jgi:hypothetical protein
MAISLQREQHGECCHMHVVMAAGVTAVVMMVIVIMVMIVMVTMMVVAMVPAVMVAAVARLAFVQRKLLAHTDVEFTHV